MDWAKQFYKEQFLLINQQDEVAYNYLQEDVNRIEEQFGKAFQTVLELGAGDGQLANVMAQRGKDVATIEFVEERVAYAKSQAQVPMTILCGDFYTIDVSEQFDCVLYIDGFGVGEDADQLRLLHRIHHWLKDDGYALIDIYEPNYWQAAYKEPMRPTNDDKVYRQYSYDFENNRFIDEWWHQDSKEAKVAQSLKCYSVKEIVALCEQARLSIVGYFPGGAVDYEQWTYTEPAALDHCISYRIKLKKK